MSFALAYPQETRRLPLGSPDPPARSLTDRHRPRTLADLVGQRAAVEQLRSFAAAPYSAAFLLEGPTGVGKTPAALALAAELGAVEFGGLHHIRSGEQDAEAVAMALDSLRFTPWGSCGRPHPR